MIEDRYIKTNEAANILDTSEYHVIRLFEAGRLNGYKLFGEVRVSEESILKHLLVREGEEEAS